ncbi:hypothetical protein [Hoeflea prorocentri]|uniref:Uncharacterized protein n=1 Tax=Hoeflea prorocentri TaxID=1922333 RepID=A0A9X3UFA6_9HYPH|nr:hypothetical protein [Hoeflea prorocentri]MCY6379687.1 hypothetical protein [Hoeflea prorocentri]MDA5397487.1 hypothetical protein [Hoeflea prorocentri]
MKAGMGSGVRRGGRRPSRFDHRSMHVNRQARSWQLSESRLLYISADGLPDHARDVADWFGAQFTEAGPDWRPDVESVDCVLCPKRALSARDRADLRRRCSKAGIPLVCLNGTSRTCFRHALLSLVRTEASGAKS